MISIENNGETHLTKCQRLLSTTNSVPSGGCNLMGPLKFVAIECNPEYSTQLEDTRTFRDNWLYYPHNISMDYLKSGSPFVYHTANEMDDLPIMGNFMSYSGGGYTGWLL